MTLPFLFVFFSTTTSPVSRVRRVEQHELELLLRVRLVLAARLASQLRLDLMSSPTLTSDGALALILVFAFAAFFATTELSACHAWARGRRRDVGERPGRPTGAPAISPPRGLLQRWRGDAHVFS